MINIDLSTSAQVLLAPGNMTVVSGDTVDLVCQAYGIPCPTLPGPRILSL